MCKSTSNLRIKEFIVSKYLSVGDEDPRCDKPERLPCGADGRECRVVVRRWRTRAFGPGYKLLQVKCKTHGGTWTVYPVGWIPYGRAPVFVADDSEEGEVEEGEVEEGEVEEENGGRDWSGTLFDAVISAASGGPGWPRENQGDTPQWWSQVRRIGQCGTILGLSGDARNGEAVSALLEVPLHEHVECRKAYRKASGYRAQARAVFQALKLVAVLPIITRMYRACFITGVCGCGYLAGPGPRLEPLFRAGELRVRDGFVEERRSTTPFRTSTQPSGGARGCSREVKPP